MQDVLPLGFLAEIQSPVSLASSLRIFVVVACSLFPKSSSSSEEIILVCWEPKGFGVLDLLPLLLASYLRILAAVSIFQTGIHTHVGFGVKDVLTLGFAHQDIQSPVSLASSRDGRLAFLPKVSCGTSSPHAFTVMYTCCVVFNGLVPTGSPSCLLTRLWSETPCSTTVLYLGTPSPRPPPQDLLTKGVLGNWVSSAGMFHNTVQR